MTNEQLLNHHLCFLEQNRGSRRVEVKNEIISSDKDSFNITFFLDNSEDFTRVNIGSRMIYLPSWINNKDKLLAKNKYSKTGSLTYMSANSSVLKKWKFNDDITIKKVTNNSDLEIFSTVQSKGFCETDEVFNEWHPWLRNKNFEGYEFKNQFFFIASINEEPVGVCLLIENEGIYGIYAVATHPKFRKKGVATTTMKKALEDCINGENANLTLQVMTGSYAEKLYENLGFKEDFRCTILKEG